MVGLLAGFLAACAVGDGGGERHLGLGRGDADSGGPDEAGDSDTGAGTTDSTTGSPPDDGVTSCGEAGQPACDCEARDDEGEHVLGPCHPACQDQYWRWSMWTTNYNVAGTLGYGEHQGNGIIGVHYRYDSRFGPSDGVAPPWRSAAGDLWAPGDGSSDAEQFAMRTLNPGAEIYVDPVVMPGDEDDLFSGETLPRVPISQAHGELVAAALCEAPQVLIDVRHYNHGRTLAQTVPNHGWDSFFTRRQLIPMMLLEVIELYRDRDGSSRSPSLVGALDQASDEVGACLQGIDDGFCDARCGNCSYVMPTGFSGLAFGVQQPGHQIANLPAGSAGPFQVGDGGPVAARSNWSVVESGHEVFYVGGSVWGRADDVSGYTGASWPDPDGVLAMPAGDAWVSMAGDDLAGGDGVPDQWEDPFTHCVDPSASWGSQRPAGLPRFISGRWGHNSNSDAEASFRQFLGCREQPVVAVQEAWTNANACDACGVPRSDGGGWPIQYPCRDLTHTAVSYWERSPGTHDVDDFDPGKHDAVEAPRSVTDRWAALPRPICRTSAEPVYGM